MIDWIHFFNSSDKQINSTFNSILTFNSSDKVFVSADKSRSIYKMDKDQYTKLLHESITKVLERLTKMGK